MHQRVWIVSISVTITATWTDKAAVMLFFNGISSFGPRGYVCDMEDPCRLHKPEGSAEVVLVAVLDPQLLHMTGDACRLTWINGHSSGSLRVQ